MYVSSQMPSVVSSNYTIQPDDEVIRYDSTGGIFNIQLPNPASGRRQLKFIATVGDNGVNLIPYGSELICGTQGMVTLCPCYGGPYASSGLVSDLVNWLPDGMILL